MKSQFATFALMRQANMELLENLRHLRRLVGSGDAFFELANLAPSHLPDMIEWASGQPDRIREYLNTYQEIFDEEIGYLSQNGIGQGYIAISDRSVQASLARVRDNFRNAGQPAPLWTIVFTNLIKCITDNNLECPEWIGFNIELPQDRRKYRVAQTVNLMPFSADTFTSRDNDLPIRKRDYRFARRAGDYFPRTIIEAAPSVGNLLFFDTQIDQLDNSPSYSGIPILLQARDSNSIRGELRPHLLEIDYLIDIRQWQCAARSTTPLMEGTAEIHPPTQPETIKELDSFFRSYVERWIRRRSSDNALHLYFGTVLNYLTKDQVIPDQGFSVLSVPSIFWSIDKNIQGAASALNFCYHRQIPDETADLLIAFSQSILQGVGHLARLQETIELGSKRVKTIFAHETRYLIPAIDSRKMPPKALDLLREHFTQELNAADGAPSVLDGSVDTGLKSVCLTAAQTAWRLLSLGPYIDGVERGEIESTDDAFAEFVQSRLTKLHERLDLISLSEELRIHSDHVSCLRGALCAAFRNALHHSILSSGLGFTMRAFLTRQNTPSCRPILVIENTMTGLRKLGPATCGRPDGTLFVLKELCASCDLNAIDVSLIRYSTSHDGPPFTAIWRTTLPIAVEEIAHG
ncbi:MAG TPA: hypothetical protein PKE26_12460 [Kiritimatiellia bacterium]|nr:hypothetical protein [Kiritimatiellia bacterium]HMO99913.1 hypothetical protein [Kiritimatiellia bacterium]HMP96054.1 hypothetical protein [Kiritimatiellia bacterium]